MRYTRTMSIGTVGAVLYILYGPVPGTGEETFNLGGVTLTLGMSKTDALAKLSVETQATQLNEISWLITGKHAPAGIIGVVAFEKDHLTKASKSWGNIQGAEAFELGKNLFNLLTEIGRTEGRTATIHLTTVAEPQGEVRMISILFPHRTVQITAGQSQSGLPDGHSLGVDEMIGSW